MLAFLIPLCSNKTRSLIMENLDECTSVFELVEPPWEILQAMQDNPPSPIRPLCVGRRTIRSIFNNPQFLKWRDEARIDISHTSFRVGIHSVTSIGVVIPS